MPQDLFRQYNVTVADNPKDLFAEANINLEQEQPIEGWKGVASDLLEEFKGIPQATKELPQALASELGGAAKQLFTDPLSAASELPLGLVEALEGAYNILPRAGQYARDKNVAGLKFLGALPESDIGETLRRVTGTPKKPGSALIGSLLPVGGATRAVTAPGVRGVAQRAGVGGGYAATQDESPIQGALLSALGEGAARAPGAAVRGARNLTPSNLLKTQLTPEQIQQNINLTEGMPTNIGDILQNPELQRLYYNTIAKTPFSGATKKMMQIEGEMLKRGDTLFDEMKVKAGLNPDANFSNAEFGVMLKDALANQYEDILQKSSNKYNQVDQMSTELRVRVGDKNFKETAKKLAEEYSDSAKRGELGDRRLIRQLNNLAELEETTSVKDSGLTRSLLNRNIWDSIKSGRSEAERAYSMLKEALDKDISEAVEPYPQLAKLNDDALNYYKNNVVPFKDKDVRKYTVGEGDTDKILQSFISGGQKSDLGNKLRKLTENLPPQERHLVPLAYYSQALEEGTLNLNKYKTLHKNLGDAQKDALFSDKVLAENADNFAKTLKLNQDVLNNKVNFKTGYSLLDNINLLNTVIGGLGGALTGGPIAGVAGASVPSLLAQGAQRYLTSPKTAQKALDKAKSKNSPKLEKSDFEKLMRDALRQSLIQSTLVEESIDE